MPLQREYMKTLIHKEVDKKFKKRNLEAKKYQDEKVVQLESIIFEYICESADDYINKDMLATLIIEAVNFVKFLNSIDL